MDICEIFGCKVFNDQVMRERLPETVYQSLKDTTRLGKSLDPEIADVVAAAMKEWAIAMGATHYTHWFQPLNNITAGKLDAFIAQDENGQIVTEFSSSALVQGEPDASSFPSGGLRATFEARGYTAWDPTSPAFVREGTLYIPTAFCSYTGEALDAKTPLLRSMRALSPQALRVLRALGHRGSRLVTSTVGAEQEYFLVDRELYEQRLDLKLCGRTLLGAAPPKGQELDDHYCGRIRLRVRAFMKDLDEQLWALGITAKTKHNEVAPAQHELAPIYETVNIACDHNLLTMEVLRETAKRHGLACLLHEKPFAGINGSGKHNNFSISTDDGINLLSPGAHPEENKLFLVTLCALIESVDTYADLVRLSAAVPGNDHRLGGNEAPPAIISIFLGESITRILTSIAAGISPEIRAMREIDTGVKTLPHLEKDDSDRNRTSPFALTGNKFEFRMLGSSQNIAFCNAILNTAVADVFTRFANRLEASDDLEREVAHIIADTIKNHGRVLYNGNNYDPKWVDIAKKRGLPVLNSARQAIEAMTEEKNTTLFHRHGVLTQAECHARHEILLEHYCKVVFIEAETMLQMVRRQIMPAAVGYLGDVAGSVGALRAAGVENAALQKQLAGLSQMVEELSGHCDALEAICRDTPSAQELSAQADYIESRTEPQMRALRGVCDRLEETVSSSRWPIPTYTDLLYRV